MNRKNELEGLNFFEFSWIPVQKLNWFSVLLQFSSYLKNIHFNNGAGHEVLFKNGEFLSGYDIVNWITFPNQTFLKVPIGMISPSQELVINEDALRWNSRLKQVEREYTSELQKILQVIFLHVNHDCFLLEQCNLSLHNLQELQQLCFLSCDEEEAIIIPCLRKVGKGEKGVCMFKILLRCGRHQLSHTV